MPSVNLKTRWLSLKYLASLFLSRLIIQERLGRVVYGIGAFTMFLISEFGSVFRRQMKDHVVWLS